MLVLTVCVQRLMYPLIVAPASLLHRSGIKPRSAAVVHFLLLLVLMVLCFFVAPAAVFSTMEMSWSFLDGIYFCFVSLSTIGLGDFVPGIQSGQKYRLVYQVFVMGECLCCTRWSFGVTLNGKSRGKAIGSGSVREETVSSVSRLSRKTCCYFFPPEPCVFFFFGSIACRAPSLPS